MPRATPVAMRLRLAARSTTMAAAALLAGCRQLHGPFGFAVFEPTIVTCTSPEGTPLALAWVESKNRSRHCFDSLETAPDNDERHPEYCELADTLRDPEKGFCSTATRVQSAHKERVQWAWILDEPEVIIGAVATQADHTTCTVAPDDNDEDGSNAHALLEGTITVTEDLGDTAMVTFDLDGAWGTVEFEVCR